MRRKNTWDAGKTAALLMLMLACVAVGYFLGRNTVSPGFDTVVITEYSAPEQQLALTSPENAVQTVPVRTEPELLEPEEKEEVSSPDSGETGLVDVNTAGQDELETLPGIGPKLAGRIIAYREEYGPFTSAEELLGVKGIGEKLLEKIRSRIVVGGF